MPAASRFSRLSVFICVHLWLILLAALPLLLLLMPVAAQDSSRPDPLPLRRLQISTDRLAAELDRLQKGILVKLPRVEFEALVQRAASAGDRLQKPPRLLEAHYRARLDGAALVGSGKWIMVNPLATPGLLPLADSNLALRSCTWDDQLALLADFDGKTPALLVPERGTRAAGFTWSLRGEPEGNDIRFSLQTPACAVATLRLTLPADLTVTLPRGGILLKTPAPTEGERDWTIGFAGKSKVELVLRRADAPGQKVLLTAHTQTTQQLTPGGLSARFEFDVEAAARQRALSGVRL